MEWTFLAAWTLASGGVAKLLAMAENIVHGWGLRRPTLQRIRTVHNLLLIAYPPTLFVSQGWLGPRLLRGGLWSETTLSGLVLWSLGGIGLLLLITSTIRHWRYRPPKCELGRTVRIVDLAARVDEPLVGEGRARWLAALPGNEQFTLAIEERSYAFARLPEDLDGVTLVHFSDLHFRGPVRRRYFEEVVAEAAALQGDILCFTGDLLDHPNCLEWVETTLAKLQAPLGCYYVLGNHDWYLPNVAEIRATLNAAGWTDLTSTFALACRGGSPLLLVGTERPWMGEQPDLAGWPSETFRILLSHSPDQIGFAREHRVDLMLAGHTHGGQIRLPILGPVYCPSRYGCRYSAGVFFEPPTLLLVSRGISGREPIRYGCRPELTKITLRRTA